MTRATTKTTAKASGNANTTQGGHAIMHQEHLQWLSDLGNWQDDMVQWQKELKKVFVGLKELQATLDAHEKTLVVQSEALFAHRQELAKHEHSLAEFEQGGEGHKLIAQACSHQEQSERHAQLKTVHEAAKQWHHSLVSQWEHLHKALFGMPSF